LYLQERDLFTNLDDKRIVFIPTLRQHTVQKVFKLA